MYKKLNKVDPFLVFCNLDSQEKNMLNLYASPSYEQSIIKDVPMDQLDYFKKIFDKLKMNKTFWFRWRGPRHDAMRGYCKKKDAKRFAVYEVQYIDK